MRVDSNSGPQPIDEGNTSGSQNVSRDRSISYAMGEDKAELSSARTQVSALAAQAGQLPEMREERVLALRQAVQSGQYAPSAEQVAGALVHSMISAFAA